MSDTGGGRMQLHSALFPLPVPALSPYLSAFPCSLRKDRMSSWSSVSSYDTTTVRDVTATYPPLISANGMTKARRWAHEGRVLDSKPSLGAH